ncbi:MAG TPA: hypothetical protein VGE07_30825 [Herpetosiphonaceae bacterium]
MTYRLSAAGRWKLAALLTATVLCWLLGLVLYRQAWAPPPAEGVARPPLQGQVVPGYLFGALLLAAPLLAWDVLAELTARYAVLPEGLRFRSLLLDVTYPWERLQSLKPAGQPGRLDAVAAPGPLALAGRLLHPQTYGRHRVPIYPDVAGRDELVAAIRRQIEDTGVREQNTVSEV